MMKFVTERDMFRGKCLPQFLHDYGEHYQRLVELHGAEKFDQMYRWCFKTLQGMRFGQYINWTKIASSQNTRGLICWCMECIYQSDLLSQLEFRREKDDKTGEKVTRLYTVEPTAEQKRKWEGMIGSDGRYLYIDWYHRLMENPNCHPDIDPKWLGLDASDANEGTDDDVRIVDDIENYNNQ